MNKGRWLLVLAVLSVGCERADAVVEPPPPGVSLTVYSAADPATFDPQAYMQIVMQNPNYTRNMPGYGVVRDVRTIQLDAG